MHAGPAYVGNVGPDSMVDFTALGDAVNTAARLRSEAAPGEALLSETVYEEARDRFPHLTARELSLRGKEESVTARTLRV